MTGLTIYLIIHLLFVELGTVDRNEEGEGDGRLKRRVSLELHLYFYILDRCVLN